MTKRVILTALLGLLLTSSMCYAETPEKSALQERAEAASVKNDIALARSSYIRAYDDYFSKGQWKQGVECGAKATALYYKENFYKEAFDLLRRIDQSIIAAQTDEATKAGLHYYTTKERLQMYMKLRKIANAQEQLNSLERLAQASRQDAVQNDLLYTKAIFYYTFGQNEKGNAVFREMTSKLTATKEYDKVDDVYQTLIANGRRSGSAGMVAQAYSSYIQWKDSVSELKRADEIGALKQQIAEGEAAIQERDSSLASRKGVIVGLSTLLAALGAVLVIGALVLLRFIVVTQKQKRTIRLANENNSLKARFISNISAQMAPTLQKLDSNQPEVRALQEFASHIQTLSALEQPLNEALELEDTQMQAFCQNLADEVLQATGSSHKINVDAPNMTARIHRGYVAHILKHLLTNAITFAQPDGIVRLEFKKRGPHKLQFLVSDVGAVIPEEKRDDIFKPFLEVRDLTTGDGLGLPICRQMALRMNGDLAIDPSFSRGTRFVLDLQV